MDLNDGSSDEEGTPVVVVLPAQPKYPAAEPAPQPAERSEEAVQQANTPEKATEVEEAEGLVAAAAGEAVVVKQEVEGTQDAASTAEVAMKQEAARPGTVNGRACGTPGLAAFPQDQHAGVYPSLCAEGKGKRRLPAVVGAAAVGADMEENEEWGDSGRKRQRVSGHAHGQGDGRQQGGAAGAGTSALPITPSTSADGGAAPDTAAPSAGAASNGGGMTKKGYCEHGRQRSRCKECGGKGMAEMSEEEEMTTKRKKDHVWPSARRAKLLKGF